MTTLLIILRKSIFWLTLIFIAITLFSLTVGQSLNYEFANNDLSSNFYNIIMPGLPIAILLTLFGTIKMKNQKSTNISIIILTILASVISFFIMVNMMFSVGFLVIENEAVLFRKKDNSNIIIAKQSIGQGALGEDGHRIVQLQPFLKFWNRVTIIDTTSIDKGRWKFVNERKIVNDNWKIENGKLIYY
jgi:hypothetical protein